MGDGDVKVESSPSMPCLPAGLCCPVLDEYVDTVGAHNEDTVEPHNPPWPASFILEHPGPLDGKDETLPLFGVPYPLPSFLTLHGARLGEGSGGGGPRLPPSPTVLPAHPACVPCSPPGPRLDGGCSCSYKVPRGHLIHSAPALRTSGSPHQLWNPRGLGQGRRLNTNIPGLLGWRMIHDPSGRVETSTFPSSGGSPSIRAVPREADPPLPALSYC